jgi:hypothetical protein
MIGYVAVLRESTVHVTDFMDPTATLLKVADVKKFPGAKSIEDIVAPREGEYALILAVLFNNRTSLVVSQKQNEWIHRLIFFLLDFNMAYWTRSRRFLHGRCKSPRGNELFLFGSVTVSLHKHIGLKYSQPLRFT